jgi:hypothetical protein
VRGSPVERGPSHHAIKLRLARYFLSRASTRIKVRGAVPAAAPLARLPRSVRGRPGLLDRVSLSALTVEEFSFRRYSRWRDLGAAVLAAVVENIGYRQLHSWWRLQGLWRFIRGQEASWGVMTRAGFDSPQ